MQKIRAAVAVGALGLCSAFASWAQQADAPGGDSATVRELVRNLLAQGKTSNESELTPISSDWIYAGNPKAAEPFVDRLQTFGGFLLKTKLPITGQPERPQKDVAELLDQFKGLCASETHEWVHKDIPEGFGSSDVPVMVRAFRILVNEGKVGQFWCQAQDGTPSFMVEVLPSPNSTVPLIPTSRDWSIGFRVASTRSLTRFVTHEAEYRASITALRSTVKPGSLVQVRTTDLPDDLAGPWKHRFPGQTGSLCGLVTEIKPPLATVQFQSKQMAVNVDQLLPQGTRKGLDDVSLSDRRTPQAWCVK